jgi:hypothetical protein
VRALYIKYGASNMGLAITEMGPGYQNDSAAAGLFAADSYLTWWENGVFNTDWFDLRNGSDGTTSTNDDGTIDYGEGGIVSTGGGNTPPRDTPYPTYYGLSLAGRAGSPGDTLVSATSSASTLKVHAVRTASGGVNVLLINEDLNNSATVAVNYTGYTPAAAMTVQQWSKGATAITTTTTSAGTLTVPPYSITLLQTTARSSAAAVLGTPTPTKPASTSTTPTTSTTPASTITGNDDPGNDDPAFSGAANTGGGGGGPAGSLVWGLSALTVGIGGGGVALMLVRRRRAARPHRRRPRQPHGR